MKIQHVYDLEVYQAAFELQQAVFAVSKRWPRDEAYSLTDQTRRSSRSIGASLAESWSKRRYPAHFLSKLTDADGELAETRHWLATAEACGYMTEVERRNLNELAGKVGRMLGSMILRYDEFCLRR